MKGEPILIEIDEGSWAIHLDRVEAWLGHVVASQAAFRRLLDDVHPRLREPHFRDIVAKIAATARRHEAEAERLYRYIGRDPSAVRKPAGEALGQARQAGSEALARAGGAEGSWTGLQALLPASLQAQAAFAVAEQLGLALGHRELAEAAYAVENEQAGGHLVLRELMLEAAAIAILYRAPV